MGISDGEALKRKSTVQKSKASRRERRAVGDVEIRERVTRQDLNRLVGNFGAFETSSTKARPRSVAEDVQESVVDAHFAVGLRYETNQNLICILH